MAIAGALLLAASVQAQAFEGSPKARLDVDHASHRGGSSRLEDGALLRRARLGFEGRHSDWAFEAEYDFAGDGEIKDAYLKYRGWLAGEVSIGQFKVPFGLEEQISSRNISFVERALPTDSFSPSRRLGIGLAHEGPRHTLSSMAFGPSIEGDEGLGMSARATFAPVWMKDRRVLHLGVSASLERVDGALKLGTPPEARPADEKLVKTGKIDAVDRIAQMGLEAAWQEGPVSVQAEWMHSHLRRSSGQPDLDFEGGYVAVSWFITGEVRPYRAGRFKGIDLAHPGGAWELTARYSRVDLDDRDIAGGREHNISLGLNWYVDDHLRLMLNYIDVHSRRRGGSDDPSILLMRAQFVF
jgi:phosphate-selective porin OprO/OprP